MSWNELKMSLQQVEQQQSQIEKWRKQQHVLARQLTDNEQQINQYRHALQQKREQLEELDTFSFVNQLRTWTGKKDRLLVERLEEAAIIELKLTEAQFTQEDLQQEMTQLHAQLAEHTQAELETKRQLLLIQMESWLAQHVPNAAQQLTTYTEKENELARLQLEIEQAIAAGQTALQALYTTADRLKSAQSMSTWDLIGGGMFVTMMKHEKLDKSNSAAHRAQMALQSFQRELLDIVELKTTTLQVEVDGLVKFADYFFDDIFSEWSIHSKIKQARQQIFGVVNDVQNTLTQLGGKLAYVEHEQEKLVLARENLLTKDEQALFLLN